MKFMGNLQPIILKLLRTVSINSLFIVNFYCFEENHQLMKLSLFISCFNYGPMKTLVLTLPTNLENNLKYLKASEFGFSAFTNCFSMLNFINSIRTFLVLQLFPTLHYVFLS